MSYRCSYCSQSLHVTCKKTANSTCQLSPHATLVDSDSSSPRKQIVSVLKITHRQRVIHSEPRKSANHQSSNSSTIQRRLPFERIFLLRKWIKYRMAINLTNWKSDFALCLINKQMTIEIIWINDQFCGRTSLSSTFWSEYFVFFSSIFVDHFG